MNSFCIKVVKDWIRKWKAGDDTGGVPRRILETCFSIKGVDGICMDDCRFRISLKLN